MAPLRLLPPAALPGAGVRLARVGGPHHVPGAQRQRRHVRRPVHQALGEDMKTTTILALAVSGALAAGCAAMVADDQQYADQALAMMKTSFKERGQAKLDRLEQDDMQRTCSKYAEKAPPKEVAAAL